MRFFLASLAAGIVITACAAPQARAEAEWQLVWSDEFEGETIDTTKWGFEIDCWGGGNDERQCYTDNSRNASVKDGKLVITARKETATGPALPERLREEGKKLSLATKPFTSARMTTSGRAAWRYGKIEIRAKLPQGQGTWPAIWMLPEKDQYGRWAASGEIDILEAVNLGVACTSCVGGRESKILGTLHFGGEWPDNKFDSTEIDFPAVLDGYHIFAIEWRKGTINWLVDGLVFASKQAADWSTTGTKDPDAPFDQPFHLILNLAIGGGLPEGRNDKGISLNDFPKEMLVDWVRVYQCSSDPETGEACANQ
jgi:beta-glucanase (GH16 family)